MYKVLYTQFISHLIFDLSGSIAPKNGFWAVASFIEDLSLLTRLSLFVSREN